MNNVHRLVDETDRNYNLRLNFIKLNNPKTNKERNVIIMYSKIFVNIITLGCRYETSIEKKLNKESNKIKEIIKKNKFYKI
jgi:hypothetical protein